MSDIVPCKDRQDVLVACIAYKHASEALFHPRRRQIELADLQAVDALLHDWMEKLATGGEG